MGLAWKTNTYSWRFESEIALLVDSIEPVFFSFFVLVTVNWWCEERKKVENWRLFKVMRNV